MTEGAKIPCEVARDLLTPWLAGDVSPGTRAWLEQHLAECEECRAAADVARAQMLPSAVPAGSNMDGQRMDSDDTGRHLLARVRRRSLATAGIIVLLLIAGIAATVWGVASVRAWANLPVAQPVPVGDVTPAQAAAVDLSHLGLTADKVITTEFGVAAFWRDTGNNSVRVDLMRFATRNEALHAFTNWERSYPVKVLSISMNTTLGRTAKFRSIGNFLYGWQTDVWFVAITVPGQVAQPATVRDGIRDALIESFARGK